MTEALLEGPPLMNVLEVGTGCGYQTAVLAPLVGKLFTIERIEPLVQRAKLRIKELGLRNVRFRHGDGNHGWKTHAPFGWHPRRGGAAHGARSAAQQLALGGRLVVPVGPEGEQELFRYIRKEPRVERQSLGPVAFVPLLGGVA